MKRLFFVTAVLLSSISVNAQFTNTRNSESSEFQGWNDFYIQYNMVKNGGYDDLNKKDKEWVPKSVNGLSIGYNRAINIVPSNPLYLLVGGAFEYNFVKEETDYSREYKGNAFSLKTPVSLIYHFDLGDNFAIEPYAGLNARYYFSASLKVTQDDLIQDYVVNGVTNSFLIKGFNEEYDPFNKKDTDGDPANHFILGGQIGITAVIAKHFTISASYDHDFTKVHDLLDDKCYRFNIGIGYRF